MEAHIITHKNKHYIQTQTGYREIVATTDKLSTNPNLADSYRSANCIPQLPESFIQSFIKAYNDGKPITEIELDMIKCCGRCIEGLDDCQGDVIKTSPDNTVIVKESKMYSRDELFELLKELRRECINAHNKGINPETIGIAQFIK